MDFLIRSLIVLSVAWTSLCVIVFVWKAHPLQSALQKLDPPAGEVGLPVVAPSKIYRELPGITKSLARFNPTQDAEASQGGIPVRIAVVLQYDSTCFVEVTRIADCGCSAGKLDRYQLIREAIDPLTGEMLSQARDEDLSAERVTQYLGGLTKNWRSKL